MVSIFSIRLTGTVECRPFEFTPSKDDKVCCMDLYVLYWISSFNEQEPQYHGGWVVKSFILEISWGSVLVLWTLLLKANYFIVLIIKEFASRLLDRVDDSGSVNIFITQIWNNFAVISSEKLPLGITSTPVSIKITYLTVIIVA